MLHSLKKKVSKATGRIELQAEFEQYRGLLERVKHNMESTCTAMDESNQLWMQQMMSQRTFATSFLEGYVPFSDGDETQTVAREFSEGSASRYDRYVRETSPEKAPYHRLQESVRQYIAEIDGVEALYPSLKSAKSEMDRYQSKVDSLTKKSEVADEKKSRNLTKQDAHREKYNALSNHVIQVQKETYSKAHAVSQMALVAYWSAQSHQLEIMQSTLSNTTEYASRHKRDLADIDVATLSVPSPPSNAPPSPGATSDAAAASVKSAKLA